MILAKTQHHEALINLVLNVRSWIDVSWFSHGHASLMSACDHQVRLCHTIRHMQSHHCMKMQPLMLLATTHPPEALIMLVENVISWIRVKWFSQGLASWIIRWPPGMPLSRIPPHAITPLQEDAIIAPAIKHKAPWRTKHDGFASNRSDRCMLIFAWTECLCMFG